MRRALALLDTNVVSYLFKGDSRGVPYTAMLRDFRRAAISFQTAGELAFWAASRSWGPRRRDEFAIFMRPFLIVHSDRPTCDRWADVRLQREKIGRPLQPEDAWIAATALELRCPLVTHDARDFDAIAGLEVLTASK